MFFRVNPRKKMSLQITRMAETYYVKLPGEQKKPLKEDQDGFYYIHRRKRQEVEPHHKVVDSQGKSAPRCSRCKNIKKRKQCQSRECYLWRTYRMTVEDYDEMWDEQDGSCAICGKEFENHTEGKVDHNHKTGNVRALLCNKCNTGLGDYDDDPILLRAAADYIEEHD
jgi:hypothetical protein